MTRVSVRTCHPKLWSINSCKRQPIIDAQLIFKIFASTRYEYRNGLILLCIVYYMYMPILTKFSVET